MNIEVPKQVRVLAENTKFPVYIVGGYIRNQIKKLGLSDVDLCGPVPAAALLLPPNYIIRTVNFRLGTAIIKIGKDEFEYTPFRAENYPDGGAHTPSSVSFVQDIKVDVQRRDFTCNSVYYDIKNDKLIDLTGGITDIENGIIRAKNPEKTFSQDGLRLMRLARISAETGFKQDKETAEAAIKNAALLRDISPERKRDELNKILIADQKYGVANAHYRGLRLLKQLKLLPFVLPRLLEGDNMAQNPLYHKYDVLEHIFQTVRFADPRVRLAALFHDIGKPYCFNKFGKMHGHEKASERIARDELGSFGLRYPLETVDEVARLVRYHMYDMDEKTSLSKLKIFIAENFDIIDKLCLLIKADKAGSGLREVPEKLRFEIVKEQMINDDTPINLSQLKIGGAKVMEMGYDGIKIGNILKDMHEKCIIEPKLNNIEWLENYARRHIND